MFALLLLLALPASAAAPKVPDCIHEPPPSKRFKSSLDQVRDCQDAARRRLIDAAKDKGKPLTYRQIEDIDDRQRAQVRDYLARSGTVIEGATKNDRGLGGVVERDLRRVSAEEGALIGDLEKRLHAAAGDGKEGVTPAMGRDILDSLEKKQGFVSAQMRDLVDAVVRDGGRLKPETMKMLQDAGRAAKRAGLDLNIDKDTEKTLLEHDFDKDRDEGAAERGDPGNL